MSKVIAVIGSSYGDEGKGLITDYHSSKYDDAVVIRSNGGAQAGHTVVTPEGQRHVFSHFGSGTLNGTPTFLSSYFVSNPMLFMKEHKLFIENFGIKPKIYVDVKGLVTTPYDMLLNQTMETMRGDDVHGSCGIGFGETLERELIHSRLSIMKLRWYSTPNMREKFLTFLNKIRDEYVPSRIDLNKVSDTFKEVINNKKLNKDFIEACQYMMENVTVANADEFKNNTLIFEGAQGLLLDMDYGYFPHVTRSNCGMKNISEILKTIPGQHDITVNYVTRAYTTRHGAGPLDDERPEMPQYYNIVDETNIPNQFQGELRFGILNMCLLQSITDKDFLNYAPRNATRNYVVTCMDQLNEDGLEAFKDNSGPEFFKYKSYGPTRKDVRNE